MYIESGIPCLTLMLEINSAATYLEKLEKYVSYEAFILFKARW